jgi:beta-galactosidase
VSDGGALDAFGPRSWARPDAVSSGRLPMTATLQRAAAERVDLATGDGLLTVRAAVDGVGAGHLPRHWQLAVVLDGHPPLTAEVRVEHPTNVGVNVGLFEGRGATLTATVPGVRRWTHETPHRYLLRVVLMDADGRQRDEVRTHVGFRRVEVVGNELRVNGRAVRIKGVNRHDHDPRRGKAVTDESMRHDVLLMKRFGVNALRTSHYPNDPLLYDLCDEHGIYVVDEANVESHAYLRSLAKDPRWTAAILERVTRMVQRDRNHPSVIAWSLGNESGSSPVHDAAAAWVRVTDPTRPVQYEGGLTERLYEEAVAGRATKPPDVWRERRADTDVVAPMYPSVDDLVAWATASPDGPDRPLVMCEYAHAMGNSGGGLADYWDAIESHAGLQGGFVWDWADQAILTTTADGRPMWAYGGDLGDEPNDGDFCCNGLVGADRDPHPALFELQAVAPVVRVEVVDLDRGVVRVTARTEFVDLSWLQPVWEVTVDGDVVEQGALDVLHLRPDESADVHVPFAPPDVAAGRTAHVTLRFLDGDHEVAWHQFELATAPPVRHRFVPFGDGDEQLLRPRLVLWRAPTDNDRYARPSPAARWEAWGLRDLRVVDEVVARDEDGALVVRERLLGAGDDGGVDVDVRHTMRVHGLEGGGVHVEHAVTLPDLLDDVARVGVRYAFDAEAVGPDETVEWFGRGPHESYRDRCASARFGRWRSTVDGWQVPYVHPQGCGNRHGVRWLRVGRVAVDADQLLDVTVSHLTDDDLHEARHGTDLHPRPETYVWLDAEHRGVGTGAVGPDTLPRHRVRTGEHRWSYALRVGTP